MKIRKAEKRTFQEFLHYWGRYYRYMQIRPDIFILVLRNTPPAS